MPQRRQLTPDGKAFCGYGRYGTNERYGVELKWNFRSLRLSMIKAISRQGGQAGILHMTSGREVIERLERHVIEPH